MLNCLQIGQTVAEIWPFFYFFEFVIRLFRPPRKSILVVFVTVQLLKIQDGQPPS